MDIADMPRGGPDASWLDRLLQTNRLEYLDRDDIEDKVKQQIIRALERMGKLLKETERNARLALNEVACIADPQILELGSGHGGLSDALLALHPTASVTVTDIDPTSVAKIATGTLGDHPRATTRVLDATAIDASDQSFDLAVFALSFHHLPPPMASRVLSEGTRVANKLLIIDLPRPPSILHIVKLAAVAPFAAVWPFAHDGLISSLRSYSKSAMRTLAEHADPNIELSLRNSSFGPQVVVARRHRPSSVADPPPHRRPT